jgi:hypothetical protein
MISQWFVTDSPPWPTAGSAMQAFGTEAAFRAFLHGIVQRRLAHVSPGEMRAYRAERARQRAEAREAQRDDSTEFVGLGATANGVGAGGSGDMIGEPTGFGGLSRAGTGSSGARPAVNTAPGSSNRSVTRAEVEGVDEGDIVKAHGSDLVVLRRGRLFVLQTDGPSLRVAGTSDAFSPGSSPAEYYDEMLIHGDTLLVIGYSTMRAVRPNFIASYSERMVQFGTATRPSFGPRITSPRAITLRD